MSAPHRGKLLDVKAAAEYSGYTAYYLRALARANRIPYVRDSEATATRRYRNGQVHTSAAGRLFFCAQDLDDYIDRHRVAAKDESAAQGMEGNPLDAYLPPVEERQFA